MQEHNDVIIGAGLGGLVTGAKLAKEEKTVLIVNQHHKIDEYAIAFSRKLQERRLQEVNYKSGRPWSSFYSFNHRQYTILLFNRWRRLYLDNRRETVSTPCSSADTVGSCFPTTNKTTPIMRVNNLFFDFIVPATFLIMNIFRSK